MKSFDDMRVALVVPTCRPESLREFNRAWLRRITCMNRYTVLDGPGHENMTECYTHESIKDVLGNKSWIISKGDSAIRSFGFYLAWLNGNDFIVTLDDDCHPSARGSDSHAWDHYRNMTVPAWSSTIEGQRVRGLPYYDAPAAVLRSAVNVGLWDNVLDFDAPTQLQRHAAGDPCDGAWTPRGQRVAPPGQYVPMCGMNLAFTREVAPLMYFGLQGRGQPVGRFDDIWCGVLAKRICDHLGLLWTYGNPIVKHTRASDPLKNLIKEAPGLAEHETYWRHLSATPLTETTPAGCMIEAAAWIGRYKPDYLEPGYFNQLAKATETWAQLFV